MFATTHTWGVLCQSLPQSIIFSMTSAWANYLWPVRHLPLGSTALAKAHLPACWLVEVMWQTQWIIDRGVQSRRKHLPAAHSAILEALSAGPRALAPTTGLPPADIVMEPQLRIHLTKLWGDLIYLYFNKLQYNICQNMKLISSLHIVAVSSHRRFKLLTN